MNTETVLQEFLPDLVAGLTPSLRDIEVRVIKGGDYPTEYQELRRLIYLEETQWLGADQLFDHNDAVGKHILLYNRDGQLMAATMVAPASSTDFSDQAGVEASFLTHSSYSSRSLVHPSFRRQGLLALVLYLAMRESYEAGFTRYVGFVEPGKIPGWKVLRYNRIDEAESRSEVGADGQTYLLHPIMGEIGESMLRAYLALPEDLKIWVQKHIYLPSLTRKILARVEGFYQLPFFQQVKSNSLQRYAYINSLTNKYQFVKWTTRILGRAVGMCEDTELRRHYAEHLRGEVNHEVWIENDLKYLGVDFDFVRDHQVPDLGVLNFMFVQEAMTASRQDPVTFLGVPLAIEAISGFLDQEFVTQLKANIKRWGYAEPTKACSFFASHVHTDGAVDGHWVGSLKILGPYLKHEKTMQMVEQIIDLVVDSLERAYLSYTVEGLH